MQDSRILWQAFRDTIKDFFFAVGFMILGGIGTLALLDLLRGCQR